MTNSYGITFLERVSQYTDEVYGIDYHPAFSKSMIGVQQSHGMTYKECRDEMKRIGVEMGLDHLCIYKLIINRDTFDFYNVTEKDNPLSECYYLCDGVENPDCHNIKPRKE